MRHVGRLLGFVLGLFIVFAVISIFVIGFSVMGVEGFLRSYTLVSSLIPIAFIIFGCLLLVPRNYITQNIALRLVFGGSSMVFLWRCIDGVFSLTGSGEFSTSPRWSLLLVAVVSGVAIWNIIAVLNEKGEQAGDCDAEEAV